MPALRHLLAAVLCLQLAVGQRTIPGQGERLCPVGWSRWSGQCFLFQLQPVTWQDASLQCQLRGGHLARPDFTVTSTYKVMVMMKGWGAIWIGLQVNSSSGPTWSDGSFFQPQDYSDWDKGFPSRKDGCVVMEAALPVDSHRGTWKDVSCLEQHGYLCQTSPIPVKWHPDPLHCGQGWMSDLDTDVCYTVIDRPLTYEQASSACRDIDGHLATIDSLHQHFFFTQMARKVAGEHSSVWVDTNTSLVYIDFQQGQDGSGDCLSLRPEEDLPPLDVTSCHSLLPSLCQRPALNTGCDSGGGWRKFGENCYKVFTLPLPWTQAAGQCSDEGGLLARCHSIEEANFVLDLVYRVLHQSGTPGTRAWLWPRVSMLAGHEFPWKHVWEVPRDLEKYMRTNPGFAEATQAGWEGRSDQCLHVDTSLPRLSAWDHAVACNVSLPFVCSRQPQEMTVVTYPPPPSTTVAPTTSPTPPTPTTPANLSDVTEPTPTPSPSTTLTPTETQPGAEGNRPQMSAEAVKLMFIAIHIVLGLLVLVLIILLCLVCRQPNQDRKRATHMGRLGPSDVRETPSGLANDAIDVGEGPSGVTTGPRDGRQPRVQPEHEHKTVRFDDEFFEDLDF